MRTNPYRPASLKYVAGKSRPTAVISASFDTLENSQHEISLKPDNKREAHVFFIELPH